MRARWLKPEFFTDKKVATMGPVAALVYQALWCMADDGGTAKGDAEDIKAQMFYRWREVQAAEISAALKVLSSAGRIERYVVGDDEYSRIVRWLAHQQVHKPSQFRHPLASQGVAIPRAGGVPEQCGTPMVDVSASPPPRHLDTKKPRHTHTPHPQGAAEVGGVTSTKYTAEAAPRKRKRQDLEPDEAFDRAFAAYPERCGGSSRYNSRLAWNSRLACGIDPADIEAGVARYAAFILATGKAGTQWVKRAETFFGPADHWKEAWDASGHFSGDTTIVPDGDGWFTEVLG